LTSGAVVPIIGSSAFGEGTGLQTL